MWMLVLCGLAIAWSVDRYWHNLIDDQNKRMKADYELLRQNDSLMFCTRASLNIHETSLHHPRERHCAAT
jgi:hypothetical protein